MAAGEKTVRVKFDGDQRGLARAAKAGERSVSKFQKAVATAGKLAKVAAIASAAGLGAAMAPALAAGLAGGIVLALGGGFLAAGIIGASKDPAVGKAFGAFGDRAKKALSGFIEPFKGPLIRAADTFGDAVERMAPTLKAVGKAMAPLIDKLAPGLAGLAENALPGIAEAAERSAPAFEKLAGFLPTIGKWIGTLATKLADLAEWGVKNADAIGKFLSVAGPIVGVILAVVGALKIWVAVQTALNVVMALNPIGLVIIAVAALIGIIIVIATKTTWFQDLWKTVWGGIKAAASAVGSWFVNTLWKGWILGAWKGITSAGGKALDWFKGLPGKIKSAFATLASIITAPFRAAFNKVADLWNGTAGQLSFTVPGWVPGLGGRGFSLPKLPHLDTGGSVRRSGLAVIHKGETITPAKADPLDRGPLMATIDLGEGITQVVEIKMRRHDRDLKRRVLAGGMAR